MATDMSRVTFYMDAEDKKELETLAKSLGCNVSSLLRDMITTSLPQLREMSDAMQFVRSDPTKAMAMMKQSVDARQAEFNDKAKGE